MRVSDHAHFGGNFHQPGIYPWLGVAFFLAFVGGDVTAADTLIEQGRRIYQYGTLPGGEPLRATGAARSELAGAQAACIACHQRSGMGGSEGTERVSAISGPILFRKPDPYFTRRRGRELQPIKPLRQYDRDAYDEQALARAIREGVDPNGRALSELMPRFSLEDKAMSALIAYLRRLSADPVPGLQDNVMHLASIISADADANRASVVSSTMTAWARSAAPGGRQVRLNIWRLVGDATTWQAQLDAFYQQEPVFAIISGAGRAIWEPVRDFCETHSMPCLFPILDFGASSPSDFYTIYFSTGVPVEARMLARYLRETSMRDTQVQQLFSDEAGRQAAQMLSSAVSTVHSEALEWTERGNLNALSSLKDDSILVAWLRSEELNQLAVRMPELAGRARIFLSAQLSPPELTHLPVTWRATARWVSVRSEPERIRGKGALGMLPWAAKLNIPLEHSALIAEVYAATYFFEDALARMRYAWNREYLVETLQRSNFNRPAGSAFFALSLGPGQQEAAKSGYLVGYGGANFDRLQRFGARIAQ